MTPKNTDTGWIEDAERDRSGVVESKRNRASVDRWLRRQRPRRFFEDRDPEAHGIPTTSYDGDFGAYGGVEW